LFIDPLLSEESQHAAPKYPIKDFNKQSVYKVIRVVDGDTVVLNIDNKDVKVRLIGIDTPETVDPRKPVQAYGKEASNFTNNLLKGEEVYIEYDGEKAELDKYGRLLAYLYRVPDGLFVNLEIVRQGYGHAYTKYPFKYKELFCAYEKRARESQKGLWVPDVTQKKDTTIPPAVKEEPKSTDENTEEVTVYITKTGKKYHRGDCEWLYASRIAVTLKEAKKRGYEPCKVCKPPE
jgi:micrococcal nuclease